MIRNKRLIFVLIYFDCFMKIFNRHLKLDIIFSYYTFLLQPYSVKTIPRKNTGVNLFISRIMLYISRIANYLEILTEEKVKYFIAKKFGE